MANVSFYNPQAEADAKRKKQIAELLMSKGMEESPNERVGRYVVAKSPLEGISKAAQTGYGTYLSAQADTEQADAAKRRQQAIAEALGSKDVNKTIGTLAQDPTTTDAAMQLYAKNLKNSGAFGVESAGFEGDIARSMYVINDPESDEISKRRAQAVIDTAKRLTGSWDPVSGNFAYNEKNRFAGIGGPQPSPQGMPQPTQSMPQQIPQPTMNPQGADLLPPPAMGQQGDMNMFQPVGSSQSSNTIPFQGTGNRKTDAALQEAQAKALMDVEKARLIAQQENQLKAQTDLPTSNDKASQALSVIDQALNSKDLPSSVGGTFGLQGRIAQTMPITEAQRNFQPLVNQIKGQAFLEAFSQLKGGGAITEVEGQKATQAIARLDQSQSEESFKSALNELRNIITTGQERARTRATGGLPAQATTSPFSQMSDDDLRKRLMGGAR